MSDQFKFALAQLNPTVGDFTGNVELITAAWRESRRQAADLVIVSELCVSGYPLEDLAIKPSLLARARQAVLDLAKATKDGPALLVGVPWQEEGRIHNAALLLEGGEITAKIFKYDLPNYGPFDEKRIFVPAPSIAPVPFRGHKLGIMICEDMWWPQVTGRLKEQGAEILIVPNGSPYETDKLAQRYKLARYRVDETGLPLIYVNQCGGQDELLFDGGSFVLDKDGAVALQAVDFQPSLTMLNWVPGTGAVTAGSRAAPQTGPAADYHAAMLGLRDYVRKNGFRQVLLGLSGGIDSALAAALAVDALGPENVRTVMMPSPYTSPQSLDDAATVARVLGCRLDKISIAPAMTSFDQSLQPFFVGTKPDLTEENIQARCRGLLLMALSNKTGAMLLATGNKSEMAVGYATLYGDMCGGYAPIKDLYKTEVYKVSEWRNGNKPADALGPDGMVIPGSILARAPSAELRPDQTDQDSLPPYEVLDAILRGLVERDLDVAELVAEGHDVATVKRVWQMLDRAEYKRRQAPPGPKLTRRHLTRDRRYPITDRFAED